MKNMNQVHIKNVLIETEDCHTFEFEENLVHQAGQFLNVMVEIEGEKHQRSYSLSTCNAENNYSAITVKSLSNGKVSNYLLNHLKKGMSLMVSEPMGHFVVPSPLNTNTLVLLAAGSGITPIYAIASDFLARSEQNSVLLLYGNRNENNIILFSKIEALKEKYKGRFFCKYTFSQPLHRTSAYGRLDEKKIKETKDEYPSFFNKDTLYYLCGPSDMMLTLSGTLGKMGVIKDNILIEHFLPIDLRAKENISRVLTHSTERIEERKVTIHYRKEVHEVVVPPNKSILGAFLEKGIQLPYSCQSGVCTACMGLCTSGKVKINDLEGLSSGEINKGYVLTCVSQPLSDDVVIEID
jgi:ring-1,2-phenylacetyl-CoA epoxidase subunit PaaE